MDNFHFKSVTIAEPQAFIKRVWVITFLILIALFLLLFLPWKQTVHGQGTLTAYEPSERQYTINAPISGYIETFLAKESGFVKKGDSILQMRDLDKEFLKRMQQDYNTTMQELKNRNLQYANFQENIKRSEANYSLGLERFDTEQKQLQNKLDTLKLEHKTLKQQNQTAQNNCRRIKSLYDDGIESFRKYELSQNRCTKSKIELDKNVLSIKTQQDTIKLLKAKRQQFVNTTHNTITDQKNALLLIQNSIYQLKQKKNALQRAINQYQNAHVIAQKDGHVVKILQNDLNRFIKQGEPLVLFAPKVTKETLRIKVSDFNMPLIKPGLKVRIMFYGWPAFQVSGWPKITYGSYGGVITRVENTSHEKGFYYAYVTADPNEEPWPNPEILRIGTQASVWVQLETVPVWYQIWRLMQAAPPQMITPDKKKF